MIVRARSRMVWGIVVGLAMAGLIGFIAVAGMLADEYWCSDRSPWWGPPQDPKSDCTGDSWASDHPGEYPWTMPR